MDEDKNKNEFLKELDIKPETDVLNQPLTEETSETTETPEEDEFKAKNRRERRLLAHNQRLREETIATNARLEALAEAKASLGSVEDDFLKGIDQIYGNDTPEKVAATELLKKALLGAKDAAKRESFEESELRRTKESQAVAQEETRLEQILEDLEDEHNIDLTSDNSTRKGFLTLLERVSPKDKEGNIIEYADPETVYELFEKSKEKTTNRAKELASRSMTRSGTSQPSKLEDDANLRFLKENDIV